jgi:ribonuclease P protein component
MPNLITTLKHRSDFLRLRRGSKTVTPYFIVRQAPTPSGMAAAGSVRVGYTVTAKCGNAVVRNRIKRRLRAVVRELFPAHAVPDHDYILIALADVTPSAADVPMAQLRAAMQRALAGRAR